MAFGEGAEDDGPLKLSGWIKRPGSSGHNAANTWKMTPATRPSIDCIGTRRVPGRDALSGSSQPKSTETDPKKLEPPSGQAVIVEPKTGERSGEVEQRTSQNINCQDRVDDTEPPSTHETAGQESIRPKANVITSRSPPPTASFLVDSPTTTSLPMHKALHGPMSSLEVHGSSIRGLELEQGNEVQPKSIPALELILEVDDESGASRNTISPRMDFAVMYHESKARIAADPSSTSGLLEPERIPIVQISRHPADHVPSPLAEPCPSSKLQTKSSSTGPKERNKIGVANPSYPTSEKERYRVSKASSSRRADIPPSRQGQRAGNLAQRPAGPLPKPDELFELLKFTLCRESAALMNAQVTKFEKLNKDEREKYRKELQKMKSRLDGMTSERNDLKACIEERRRELGEAEKALKDVETAKENIERQQAQKDRALSNQNKTINELETQLGEARNQGKVASMMEQSCLPLKSSIDEIRSQLDILLDDKRSNQDTSEILKTVRQIRMSAKGLMCDFTKAHQSVDQLAAQIDANIKITEKEMHGSAEAISSLKVFFSAEIGATRQAISTQQELQERCSELRQENASLTERNAKFQERTANVERQLEAASNSEATLQQTVKKLQDEVTREKAAAAMSRGELQRQRENEASNGRLTSDLEASRSELQLKRDELEARCKSEKDLQARVAVLQEESATSGNEKMKKQYEQKAKELRYQLSEQTKEAVRVAQASWKNDMREHQQKAERATAELEKLVGPNSRLKKLEDEKAELNRQINELEVTNSNLASKESTATAELSTLRSQAEELQNKIQKANEKAISADKGRQETQSELDKTKEALREASSFAQRVEELGEQVQTLTEKEKALRKELEEADEIAANRHARDEMELQDDWVVAVFEVEQRLEKANDRCHEAEAEAWQHSNECRQLREENQKLHKQLEAVKTNGTTSSRPQSFIARNESPVVDTPPTSNAPAPKRPRNKSDLSKTSITSTEQSYPPPYVRSTLSQSGQATSQETSGPINGSFDDDEVIVRQTAFAEDDFFNELVEQNGTQVIPDTFPSWTANKSDEMTGLFTDTLPGPSQPSDRVPSSHSEFQDLYQQPVEYESLVDRPRSVAPTTPRGKSVMLKDERPRSRANTGRRLSQIASSDGQGTPLAKKSQLDFQQPLYINLDNLNVEDRGSPDFMKPPAKNILKTYGKHTTSQRSGNSQSRPNSQSSSTSAKRPACQSERETESQKHVRQAEILPRDGQTMHKQELNRPEPARTLSQSTHMSGTQFPSQLHHQSHSQSQSQASSPPNTRMRFSQGRNTPMTGPSQAVRSRAERRTSSNSQMRERFSQETRQ